MDIESNADREPELAEAFVHLADSLVDEFNITEMLDGLTGYCVDLLDVDAAGLLLQDRRGRLRVIAASAEQVHLVELFATQAEEGPCQDCYRQGREVLVPDFDAPQVKASWPYFISRARLHGFHAAHALPMRLRRQTMGALTLFHTTPTAVPRSALRVAQSFADIATIAILQQRGIADSDELAEQLQDALTSRLVVERAKATLAERHGTTADEAFSAMRTHARNNKLKISDLAQAICSGTEAPVLLKPWASPRQFRTDSPTTSP